MIGISNYLKDFNSRGDIVSVKRTKLFYMVWLYLIVYIAVVLKGINNYAQVVTNPDMQAQFELSLGLLFPHLIVLFIGLILSVIASVRISYKWAFGSAILILFGSGIYPYNFWWVAPVVLTAFLAYIKQKQMITKTKNIFRL